MPGRLIFALIGGAIASCYALAASAADLPEPYCYMQLGDRTINLNQLCNSRPTLSSLDQLFLARYQALTRNRAGGRPQNPELVVNRARQICAAMRSGELATNMPIDTSRALDASILKDLALQNYCPDLED